jgi:predicted naringenin-chalcone synthase
MSDNSHPATIVGIGTSNPQHLMPQSDALKMFQDLACVDHRQQRLAKVLFERAQVDQRYTCVPHRAAYRWCSPELAAVEDDQDELDYLSRVPEPLPVLTAGASAGLTTGQRSKIYARYAGDLAVDSARAALNSGNVEASSVTHIVTVSCTGFASPGVDIHLIKTLDLPSSVQRTNVAFMGCHGAINGVRAATNIVRADPRAVVLMTAVELCSLHCRFQWETEKIVGNALFGDGSASLVFRHGMSSSPTAPATDQETTNCWEVIDCGSTLIPDSEAALSWHVGDHGFEMILTNAIGEHIETSLHHWLKGWLNEREITLDQIEHWGVHPGGPRILAAVKNSLQLTEDQLATSMKVLKTFGNMSSPTVLFILDEFGRSQAADPNATGGFGLLLAFGPGMIAEVALLKSKR